MLDRKRAAVVARIRKLEDSVDYIDFKQSLYDAVLSGELPYRSNLIAR
ncbi:hypothetical protein [Bifidobacterium choerinum]|uniref:Uncharacterized protein n=1 Tax=Bifidobacterium choerinum TaxID=35760 RepID=A0A087ABW2_9BIFI|nr:hypothetical protein [Bifidobacterium choerinum]KFI56262.1 hypothetical protein BCHO_1394 [Bifidobacterium choerinum]